MNTKEEYVSVGDWTVCSEDVNHFSSIVNMIRQIYMAKLNENKNKIIVGVCLYTDVNRSPFPFTVFIFYQVSP